MMLLRVCWATLVMLMLAACGRGSEDFTVRIARPVDRVMQVLGHSGLDGKISGQFAGLKVERSEPGKNEVLYTLPGKGSASAQIHFVFEPVDGGKSTVVHAAIDMPPVTIDYKGKSKVISETRVEVAVRQLVGKIGTKLESGSDTVAERAEFAQLLTLLGIVSDSTMLQLALDMERNPDWYMGSWGSLYDREDTWSGRPDRAAGNRPVGIDPNAGARAQEDRARESANANAAPMNDAKGYSASGDTPNADRARGDDPTPGGW